MIGTKTVPTKSRTVPKGRGCDGLSDKPVSTHMCGSSDSPAKVEAELERYALRLAQQQGIDCSKELGKQLPPFDAEVLHAIWGDAVESEAREMLEDFEPELQSKRSPFDPYL